MAEGGNLERSSSISISEYKTQQRRQDPRHFTNFHQSYYSDPKQQNYLKELQKARYERFKMQRDDEQQFTSATSANSASYENNMNSINEMKENLNKIPLGTSANVETNKSDIPKQYVMPICLKPDTEMKDDSYKILVDSLNLQLINIRMQLDEALKNMSSEENIREMRIKLDVLDTKIQEIEKNIISYSGTVINISTRMEKRFDDLENTSEKKERTPTFIQLENIKQELHETLYETFQETINKFQTDIDTINLSLGILQMPKEAFSDESSSITHGCIPGTMSYGDIPSILYKSVGAVSCNGEIYMTIENFSNKLDDAIHGTNRKIYSKPFYSSGYKMRMLIYPNGCDQGLNKYISIYFLIVKGENDNMLIWPFSGRVECKLHSYGNYIMKSDYFIMDDLTNIECTRQPIKEMNKPNGFPVFATLFQVNKALINNTLCISMNVEYKLYSYR